MSIFFDRFSTLCKEAGETPNSLAKKLHIPSGSITAWKKGTTPRMQTLDMLAGYFRVSVDYLIGNVSEPYFYLDNTRVKSDINGERGKAPTQAGVQSTDPDIRRIERAKLRMSEREWKHQMDVIAASMGDYFSDDYEDDDLDE